jgi:hypothetical protein
MRAARLSPNVYLACASLGPYSLSPGLAAYRDRASASIAGAFPTHTKTNAATAAIKATPSTMPAAKSESHVQSSNDAPQRAGCGRWRALGSQHLLHRRSDVRLASAGQVTLDGQFSGDLPV